MTPRLRSRLERAVTVVLTLLACSLVYGQDVGVTSEGGVDQYTLTLGKELSGAGVNDDGRSAESERSRNAETAVSEQKPPCCNTESADESLDAAVEGPKAPLKRQTRAGQPDLGTRGIEGRTGKPGPSLVTPAFWYGGAALADLSSTHYALERGAREAWLPGDVNAWKALQVAALVAVDVELQKRGRKGSARVLRVVAVVVGAGLAVHNVRVARRQR